MLVDVLNDLTRLGKATDYQSSARALGPSERRAAAVLHVSALLEVLPEGIGQDRLEFGGLSVSLTEVSGTADLRYEDLGIGYALDGARLARQDGPATMSGLLELLIFARERSDTLLFQAPDVRNARILDLATRVGASDRFVRFILAHAPAIDRKLAA